MTRFRIVWGLLGVAGFLAAAELITASGDPEVFPPVRDILGSTLSLAVDPDFVRHTAKTLIAWLEGLVWAALIGIPAGAALGVWRRVHTATHVVIEFTRSIPTVALIPTAILLLGSATMKPALIAFASVWPILFNTLYGIRQADPLARETLLSYGFGRLAVLWWVYLPSAGPFVLTGVRLAASIALIVAIGTELLSGGDGGLGNWLMITGSAGGRLDTMIGGAVWAGVLGLIVNGLFVGVQRLAFAWARPTEEAR